MTQPTPVRSAFAERRELEKFGTRLLVAAFGVGLQRILESRVCGYGIDQRKCQCGRDGCALHDPSPRLGSDYH
jgi:hypothetical protein